MFTKQHEIGNTYSFAAGGGWYEKYYSSVNIFKIVDFAANTEHKVYSTMQENGNYLPREIKIITLPFDTLDYSVQLDSIL